jgi:hypothetical protein
MPDQVACAAAPSAGVEEVAKAILERPATMILDNGAVIPIDGGRLL